MEIINVTRIWDQAPHNAFTDLIRFQDRWFCTFREDETHNAPGSAGKIRILSSDTGKAWQSSALLELEGDLRDPKLSRTPDNQLQVTYFRRFNPHRFPDQVEMQYIQRSANGSQWTTPVPIGHPNRWLWRISWFQGVAYGIDRGGPPDEPPFFQPRTGRLLASEDGIHFQFRAFVPDGGEATLQFLEDGTALCLRRPYSNWAFLGKSSPPYTEWEWVNTGTRLGGPDFLQLPNGRWVAGGRLYEPEEHTALCWLDVENHTLEKALELPSGGDSSYPGMVVHQDQLWVSYYSSHEGKSNIYLARVQIS